MGVLDEILDTKRRELLALGEPVLPSAPASRPLALGRKAGEPLRIIAEIKRRSPSAGALSTTLSVGERAAAYARAGASMLSVLCDSAFFDGSYEHLQRARDACDLPLLCKEFVLDERQLDLARAHGADAVLLIVRCLPEARVEKLVTAARERGLEPLVEVTTEAEARIAVQAGARLIGVNARDLDTLQMDPARATAVLAGLPSSVVRVHLSGLGTPEAVAAVAQGHADAALLGEALMRLDDPEPLLRRIVEAAAALPKRH
jgi:indole-3-glycerol phosphate synthase